MKADKMVDSESGSTTVVADERGETLLCASCQQLDLSVHKFIINRSRFTQSHSSGNSAHGRSMSLNSGDGKRVFGRLDQVKERCGTCRFCDLAYRAVQRYSGIRVGANTNLFLTWEVDGRQITKGERAINCTRRIRLSWRETSGKEESVYLVLVAPKGSRRINSDAYASNAKESHFLARGLVDNKEKQALMKSWIDLCVNNHGSKCKNTHGTNRDFRRLIKSTYFGVVDVIDMQLKALPIINGKPERYVAISYVWGKNPLNDKPYVTTRANVMVRIQHGGLESAWERLPRTIQESILLVARLGERYVWIDSLCIVQDSTSSWELNAKAMHLVYGNAHFTICAADGDVDVGLRAVSPTLRAASPTEHLKRASNTSSSPPPVMGGHMAFQRHRAPSPVPNSKIHLPSRQGMTTEEIRGAIRAADAADVPPLTAECLPGVRLLVSKPPETVVEDSIWNKRGWTFQERLLSRRCLIFAEGQVYFQCRSTVISQHIFTDGGINGWSLDWTNSPLRTLGELQHRAFWFYMKCVPLYTDRNLTQPKDILTAFQGTAWLLQQQLNAPLFYGLPSSHFDLALLWMPTTQLSRRRGKPAHKRSVASCTQDEMGNCKCNAQDDGYGGKEFPSWAWSGWIGGKAEYTPSIMEGCVSNVQEWLRDHTWIRWYYPARPSGHPPPSPPRVRYSYPPPPMPYPETGEYNGNTRRGLADRFVYPDPKYHGHVSRRNKRGSWSRQTNKAYLQRLPQGYYEGEDEEEKEPQNSRRSQSYKSYKSYKSPAYPTDTKHQKSRKHTDWDLGSMGSGDDAEEMMNEDVSSSSSYTDENFDRGNIYEEVSDSASEGERKSKERKEDNFGRPIRPSVEKLESTKFTGILPDNPFSIIRGPFSAPDEGTIYAMPILQFWTWQIDLLIVASRDDSEIPPDTAAPGELRQYSIVDKGGDWCGSIVLPRKQMGGRDVATANLIALSDAKKLTEYECPVWNYYIPKEREESEWDLYYVMMLERNHERALWERVAIGKVFQAAFRDATWDEIKLG
ncbi:hypothetical protein PG985_000196 [Apiospora marii]|uniref:uncharacterized protein n=1 Tax=Apiospora marii TaxID=335849 RepID=UPI0031323211